jgi:HPt (histidine-containing phosphotransfer) domain-containing protein
MENGFDGFISKPIDIRQLNFTLNKLIRDKHPPEVVDAARQQAANLVESAAGNAGAPSNPELAAIFAWDAEKAITRLKTIFDNAFRRKDDIRQYVIDVHSMKSALANIGESDLSAVALNLEQAGRSEDIELMKDQTPAFLEALRQVIEKNKPQEDESDIVHEESENDRKYLNEKLLIIQKACEEYDVPSVNAAMAELKQRKWPHSSRKLLETISEYLLHSDFEEAAKLIEELLRVKTE